MSEYMPEYKFAAIAEQLIASLIKGAEDNVNEATALLDSVRILGEEIRTHVEEHTKMLNDATERTRAYGEKVLTANRVLITGGKHENPTP